MMRMIKSIIFLLIIGGWCSGNIYASDIVASSIIQQDKKITGTVEDSFGPVTGATVVVKGTSNGTVTDLDGNFSLNVQEGQTIVISFIGYIQQEIQVGSGNLYNVFLQEDTQTLDEVVVTALGIKRESKKLGYAMTTIQAGELVKTGAPNFATSLYGKASGVRVQAAPGGNTSAVSINIRGLNSITGTNQPLIVVDGIPIRNGDANTDGYWDDQRVNSNGLVDINPEDIADLSILKGASASALYGSEAANGVVLITTKTGQGKKGLGIDFNMTFGVDKVAYMPEFQTTFGPGRRHESRSGEWLTGNGWKEETYNGKTYYRPDYETSTTFGPKFDGRDVLYWDGSVRPYTAYDNGWNKLFRTGTSGTYNLAITNGGENSNVRFSYTYNDNKSVQRDSHNDKHNFNLAGSFNPHKRLKIDYTANYMRQNVHNRPYRMSRITNNFTGLFTNFDDTELMRQKTVTSLGYLNVPATNPETLTPNESFLWKLGAQDIIEEYFWNSTMKLREEAINRFISSATATVQIIDGLSLRGRIATDLTSTKTENKEHSTKPLAYGPSGNYNLENYRYEIYYGDALLMFDRTFNDKWGITANAGFQGRIEQMYSSKVGTDKLSVENWFHLDASSVSLKEAKMKKQDYMKQAFLATLGVSYNNYLFMEVTGRQEKSSTLPPGYNSFFYPSVNASFLFSDAIRDKMPDWIDYAKVRGSFGIVGNAPEVYKASFAYKQDALNDYIYNQLPDDLGNQQIRPEEKHEWEFGLESKMFGNRLGFEVTYYTNVIKDQILDTTIPWSSGAARILQNVGELQNRGWELSLYGTPIQTRDWQWDIRGNISFNKNQVNKLAAGLEELEHANYDNGSVRLVSRVGEKMGNFVAHVPLTDGKGNPIVDDNGLYIMDRSQYQIVGNAMPDAVGGISTTLNWKNLFVDMSFDFRIGGDVLNTPYQYMMNRGSIVESMKWRDAANGGLSYYYNKPDDLNSKVASSTPGPNGQILYDDGLILPGVKEDGELNDIIISAASYYNRTYGWGPSGYIDYSRSVFKNTYVKMRELSIGYSIPSKLLSKFHCNNLTVSVYGRNLFFIYKNLPSFDAEATDGTTWIRQADIGGSTATTRSFGVSLRASF